jgi:hypothetical protein
MNPLETASELENVSSAKVALVRPCTALADSVAIFAVGDDRICYVSPPAFPSVAQDQYARILAMKDALGSAAYVLPTVFNVGSLADGRTYLIVARYSPLRAGFAGKLDRIVVRRQVYEWIFQSALQAQPPCEHAEKVFTENLKSLAEVMDLPVRRFNAQARFVPMHGDLWCGNVMRSSAGIRLVDWGDAQVNGFGIYDLVRARQSFGGYSFCRELKRHAHVLGGAEALEYHLLAALGHFARNLVEFPVEKFRDVARGCWETLQAGLHEGGGAGGIRTLDTVLPYTHFPGERLRPLGHRSARSGAWKAPRS